MRQRELAFLRYSDMPSHDESKEKQESESAYSTSEVLQAGQVYVKELSSSLVRV